MMNVSDRGDSMGVTLKIFFEFLSPNGRDGSQGEPAESACKPRDVAFTAKIRHRQWSPMSPIG